MPQVSSKVNSARHNKTGRKAGGGRSYHRQPGDPEAQLITRNDDKDHDIGLPRLVARIWGLVSGISYVSNGGYLLVESSAGNEKCQAAGGYMIFAGLVMIIMECGCCIMQTKNNCCDDFENKFPFWARGLIYLLSTIPALALCFGTKTLITSIIVITLALIYIFLTCLVRSKRYERLRGAARARYEGAKKDSSLTYSAMSGVNATVNYMKMNSPKHGKHGRGRSGGGGRSSGGRSKKPRTHSAHT